MGVGFEGVLAISFDVGFQIGITWVIGSGISAVFGCCGEALGGVDLAGKPSSQD